MVAVPAETANTSARLGETESTIAIDVLLDVQAPPLIEETREPDVPIQYTTWPLIKPDVVETVTVFTVKQPVDNA